MQIQSNDVDVAASDSPRNWPGSSRWQFDRGAMPGEPFAFLDGDCETGSAAMVEVQTPARPSVYEVRSQDGALLSRAFWLSMAASEAIAVLESRVKP